MNVAGLREKVKQEINRVPDEHLAEVYDVVRHYSLIRQSASKTQSIMDFAGAWQDMPDQQYEDFLSEVNQRRRVAGKRRRGA
ncbi:MAG: hypothetical protein QNK37_24690 [Acidobacteriota bacterium]|nr:hypothetical protein [Acidobacteriota bacterium]